MGLWGPPCGTSRLAGGLRWSSHPVPLRAFVTSTRRIELATYMYFPTTIANTYAKYQILNRYKVFYGGNEEIRFVLIVIRPLPFATRRSTHRTDTRVWPPESNELYVSGGPFSTRAPPLVGALVVRSGFCTIPIEGRVVSVRVVGDGGESAWTDLTGDQLDLRPGFSVFIRSRRWTALNRRSAVAAVCARGVRLRSPIV